MAIVTRVGKGSKLTTEEMDNNLLSLETDISGNVSSITSKLDKGSYTGSAKDLDNAIAANVTLIASKLDKGAYTGTAKDLENAIVAAVTGASGISIVPTSPAPAGTGIASFTATQAGTYTNYGGVVVNANSFAVISRSAAGVFSISQTALDLTTYAKVVDVDKKANLVVEKNIFNKATATIGFTISQTTGALTANSSYDTSDFMPIVVGQVYKSNSDTRLTTYFDSNKAVVSGGSGVGITSFTTPSGVAFIRVSIVHSALNTYQLEKGTVATAYEDYTARVQETEISKTISRKADLPDFNTFPKLVAGKNLFNKNSSDVVLGSYVLINSGNTGVNASYNATGFIKITGSTQYSFNPTVGENAWYDASKVFISGFGGTTPLTSPSNAVYARCSVRVTEWSIFQFELGATVTAYESFSSFVRTQDGTQIKSEGLTDVAILEVVNAIPVNSIPASKIIDNSIVPTKTNFFEGSRNLFNPYDTDFQLGKYLDNSGNVSGSASASLTGFIPIVQGQTLFCNKHVGGGGMNHQYNSSKVLIASTGVNTATITGVAGSAFVRYSIQGITLATVLANNTQVEVGTIGTTFINFSVIKSGLLPTQAIQGATSAIDMQLPSTLYLTNTKTDFFFTPFVKNFFQKNKFIRVEMTNSVLIRQFRKLATFTPSSNGVATFTLYNDSFEALSAKAVNTVITPITKTGNLKTLFLGSSITGGAIYIEYIKSICGSGVSFLGTRISSAGGVQHEGRGGFGLSTYFGISTLQGIAHKPFYHPTTGRHWGSTAYWAEVLANDEFTSSSPNAYDQKGFKTTALNAGFLSSGKISGARLLTNDIMYDNALSSFIQWNGSVWNTIAQPTTWGVDFVKYGAMWNVAAPDLFFIAELATNDFRGSSVDPVFTTWNSQVEQILTALKVWNPSVKLAMTINFSSLGGEYTAGEFIERNNYRMWQCRKNCITNFDNRVADGIYLIDNGIGFDEDYAFPISTDVNLTLPYQLYKGAERLRVQINSPHPDADGVNSLGSQLIGIIQFLRV